MESIEKHIEEDKKILQDPTTNPQMRRHIEGELHELEEYVEHHTVSYTHLTLPTNSLV